MIDLYYWPTPNGVKVSIFCREADLAYRLVLVDISKGEQFAEDFLRISPNNRMPAIVDPDGPDGSEVSVFESGAILIYLAEKTGRFLPPQGGDRYRVLEWLMWQMAGVGPMLGQNHHFRAYAPERIPYAIERYTNEANRLYAVLDQQLEGRQYLAGDYSIADMATFPWILPHARQGVDIEEYENVAVWVERMRSRPAVAAAVAEAEELRKKGPQELSAEAREVLFGKRQRERR